MKAKASDKIKYLSWADYENQIINIKEYIDSLKFTVDLIIPIMRGGMIPAVSLSHILGVRKMGFIDLQRNPTDDILNLPPEGFSINGFWLPDMSPAGVLIVDDIIGYGQTSVKSIEMVKNQYPLAKIFFVSLFNDRNLRKCTDFNFQNNVYWVEEILDHKWVKFCWEQNG